VIRSLAFIAQVDLIWKNLKKQHGVCAAAELNKILRYIVSLLGDPAALNASCPAMLKGVVLQCVLTYLPWRTGTSMAATWARARRNR
jgi:hypothetical protein